MKDEGKTREQLINELAKMRQRIVELETVEDETSSYARQLSRLNEATRAISATLDMQQVLHTVSRHMAGLLSVDGCMISDWDRERDRVQTIAEYPHERKGELDLPDVYPLDQHLATRQVLLERVSVQIHAADADADPAELAWMNAANVASLLMLPLVAGDRVVGLLELVQTEHYPFNASELQLAQTLANQAAVAIENARLFEEIRSYRDELEQRVIERTAALARERDRVETLYRITSELGASLDLDRVLNRALSLVLDAVKVERGSVFMLDQQTGHIIHKAALWSQPGDSGVPKTLPIGGKQTRFKRGEGLAGWVMKMKQPAIVGDIYEDPRWSEHQQQERRHRAVLAVPLIVSDEATGALLLFHSQVDYFGFKHLRMTEALAVQVATAINNAELYRYVRESATRLGQTMKEQREDTAKIEPILEGVDDGVMVTDASGQVIRFNAAAERILNTPRDQILGRSIDDLLWLYGSSGDVWAKTMDYWMVSPPQAGEETFLTEQLKFEDRVVSVFLSPTVMHDEFQGTLSLFRDVTHIVERDSLRIRYEQLVALDKRKSEFLSTVSHELRSPLTPIKGCIENMLSEMYGPITDKQRTRLEVALASVNDESRLVENLLDLVRIQEDRVKPDMEHSSVVAVVRSVAQVFEYDADKKHIKLQTNLPEDALETRLDRGKIKQVLTNLIGNAIKFTAEHGLIDVSAWGDDEWITVQVKDTGIGIPAHEHEKIFDRFYQVDSSLTRKVGGAGIGLNIVREYVAMHGGQVEVQSELGHGSTFRFTLPRIMEGADNG